MYSDICICTHISTYIYTYICACTVKQPRSLKSVYLRQCVWVQIGALSSVYRSLSGVSKFHFVGGGKIGSSSSPYGMATISRLLKIIGPFCRI